jgi:hypothetical protein
MAVYSWKNYSMTERAVLPAVMALTPKHEQKTADVIASMLPSDGNGAAARDLLDARVGELTQLHQAWLNQATAYRDFARTQLMLWIVATAGVLGLMVIHYREGHRAR